MRLYGLLVGLLLSTSALAAEVVRVGVYDFPPYVFIADQNSGITLKMITAMNKFQHKYEFVAVPTTARRRYKDFKNNKFDVMMFESIKWGWQNFPVIASQAFITGAEVYVSKAKEGRGQEYFSNLTNKALIGVFGYHYQFASFNTESDYLNKHFNFVYSNSQQQSLQLILNNRGDIAILSKEYLHYHFDRSPSAQAQLLISDKVDQIYQHTILVRKHTAPSIAYINQLLEQMELKGVLTPLWQEYGLKYKR